MMDCLFAQKKTMVEEEYDKYENLTKTSIITKSGREIPYPDIPLYHIHSNLVIENAEFWEDHADSGLKIKGKIDFNRLYGFDFFNLRKLERDGFIKIKKLSKNPYNVEIKTTDKKYMLSEILDDLEL